jgi:osmotically-inducible protein OsmY
MKALYSIAFRTFLCTGLLLGSMALAKAYETAGQQTTPAADNSKMNQEGQSANEPTADQQKNNRTDQEITRQIRQSIMADKSLSTYAHNVKIIAQNGEVTLKGPVRSEDEKQSIASKATAVAGENKVTDDLSIKPKQ